MDYRISNTGLVIAIAPNGHTYVRDGDWLIQWAASIAPTNQGRVWDAPARAPYEEPRYVHH